MEEISDVNVQGAETQPDFSETDAGASSEEQSFSIPDEYKEKGWTKNLKSIDDLWKMNDNAQNLIGKKTIGIPSADATDEELSEFYSKIRPENQTDYNVDLEGEDKELFESLFFENGLSQRQANALIEGYKQSVDLAEREMKSQEGYKQELVNRFGDNAQTAEKNIVDFIKKEVNEQDRAALEAMPNNVLGIVYSLINKVQERYAVKDTDTGISGKAGVIKNEPDWAAYTKAATELSKHPYQMSDLNALRDKYNIPHK